MGGGGSAPSMNTQYMTGQQEKGNINTAVNQTRLNHVNQVTPYGNLTYEQTGGTHDWNGNWIPSYTATQTMSPEQQSLYDKQTALQGRALDTADTVMNNVNSAVSTPLNYDGLQEITSQENYRNDAMNALEARGSKSIADAENAQRVAMANQGVAAGSTAYGRGLEGYGQQRVDNSQQALINATGLANQNINQQLALRNQGIGERTALRNQPLQDYATLSGFGGSTTQPNYVQTPQTQIMNTDYVGPEMAKYQSQVAQQQANAQSSGGLMSGIMGLAGTLGGSALMGGFGGSMFGSVGKGAGSGWTY